MTDRDSTKPDHGAPPDRHETIKSLPGSSPEIVKLPSPPPMPRVPGFGAVETASDPMLHAPKWAAHMYGRFTDLQECVTHLQKRVEEAFDDERLVSVLRRGLVDDFKNAARDITNVFLSRDAIREKALEHLDQEVEELKARDLLRAKAIENLDGQIADLKRRVDDLERDRQRLQDDGR